MSVVPRWEWRIFGDALEPAAARLEALTPERAEEGDELYLLSPASDASVKVRAGLIDVKHLLATGHDGLERWTPVLKAAFPLAPDHARFVLETLGVRDPHVPGPARSPADLLRTTPGVLAVDVRKRRAHHRVGGCRVELTELEAGGGRTRTIAVEDEDPALVTTTVHALGLAGRPVVCMARGLKALAGVGTRRCAAIDVGTNSVKFHVGDRRADGTWRTVADRAEVTRLGEGLDATGCLAVEPVARTVAAIVEMADEAARLGAGDVVAVGTAALRIAPNAGDLIAAVEERCRLRVEVLPAEAEARLAYLAASAALPLPRDAAVVVFDTGGGSSQFTFGRGGGIDERFSLDVGAVRLTERFGLDGPVDAGTVGAARAAVAQELGRVHRPTPPDTVVGMGGAVTNLAAVRHALAAYDAGVVQGTRLGVEEIDRQIELYRTRTAAERRSVVGLQDARAPVILAGACIVRTVLDLLGRDELTVSDRGLRHGLLAERFGAVGPPLSPRARLRRLPTAPDPAAAPS